MTYHSYSEEMRDIAARASRDLLARDVFPDFVFHVTSQQRAVTYGFIEYTGPDGQPRRLTACRFPFDPDTALRDCLTVAFGLELGLPVAPSVFQKDGRRAWSYSLMPYDPSIVGSAFIGASDPSNKDLQHPRSRHNPHYQRWQQTARHLTGKSIPELEFRIFQDNVQALSAEIPFHNWIASGDYGPSNLALSLEKIEEAWPGSGERPVRIPYYRFDFHPLPNFSRGPSHPLEDSFREWQSIGFYHDEKLPKGQYREQVLENGLIRNAFLPFIDQGEIRKVTKAIRNFEDDFIFSRLFDAAQKLNQAFPTEIRRWKRKAHPSSNKDPRTAFLQLANLLATTLIKRRGRLDDFMEPYLRPQPPASGNPFVTFRSYVDELYPTPNTPSKPPGPNNPPRGAGL